MRSFPPFIQFQPSGVCNSNCQLCPVGIGIEGPKSGFMDLEVFRSAIIDARRYALNAYFGDWGEPFTNPVTFDMISLAESANVSTSASTNLHAFRNECDLRSLLDCGLSATLVISLHGATPETYEAYQPGRSFKETIEKIEILTSLKRKKRSSRPSIKLMFAITKKNQHEISKMKQLCLGLGVECKMYSASVNSRLYLEKRDELSDIITEWAQDAHWDHTGNEMFLRKRSIQKFYEHVHQSKTIDLKELDMQGLTGRHFCSDPWRSLIVNWDGTVALCCSDYGKYTMGDVTRRSLVSIWNDEEYRNVRRFLSGSSQNLLPSGHPCNSCVLY